MSEPSAVSSSFANESEHGTRADAETVREQIVEVLAPGETDREQSRHRPRPTQPMSRGSWSVADLCMLSGARPGCLCA